MRLSVAMVVGLLVAVVVIVPSQEPAVAVGYPLDVRYGVDVVDADGSVAYTEFHEMSLTSHTHWTDVVVGFSDDEPCPQGAVGLAEPDVVVDEPDQCVPISVLGFVTIRDGDVVTLGHLPEGSGVELEGRVGLAVSRVDHRTLETAVTESAGPDEQMVVPSFGFTFLESLSGGDDMTVVPLSEGAMSDDRGERLRATANAARAVEVMREAMGDDVLDELVMTVQNMSADPTVAGVHHEPTGLPLYSRLVIPGDDSVAYEYRLLDVQEGGG